MRPSFRTRQPRHDPAEAVHRGALGEVVEDLGVGLGDLGAGGGGGADEDHGEQAGCEWALCHGRFPPWRSGFVHLTPRSPPTRPLAVTILLDPTAVAVDDRAPIAFEPRRRK